MINMCDYIIYVELKRRQKLLEPSAPAEAQHGSIKVVALAEHSGPEFAGGPLTEDFRRQHFYGDRLKRLPSKIEINACGI